MIKSDWVAGVKPGPSPGFHFGGCTKQDNFSMSGTLAGKKLKNFRFFDDFFDKIIEKFSIFLMKL